MIGQLMAASIIIMFLDELIQKGWGLGSGISLFIMAGVAQQILWSLFSPLPAGDGGMIGILPFIGESILNGNLSDVFFRSNQLPSIFGLCLTAGIMLILVFTQGMKIEIPIVSTKYQAARLAEALAQERVEILITSDLVRTVETAEIVASRLALEAYRESGLRELDAGSWSGSSRQQIASRDGDLLDRFDTGDVDVRAGGGECRREVAARARQVLAQWAAQHAGRRVAVVTHSGVIRSLLPDVRVDHARWHSVHASAVVDGFGTSS